MDIPSCLQVRGSTPARRNFFLQGSIGRFAASPPVPNCAIIKWSEVPKVPPENRPGVGWKYQELPRITRRLYEIALILNTITGVYCLPYYHTSYLHPTTPFGPFSPSAAGVSLHDVIVRGSAKLPIECEATIDDLLVKYEQLNKTQKGRIARILNRLAQAKGRVQIEDKILISELR